MKLQYIFENWGGEKTVTGSLSSPCAGWVLQRQVPWRSSLQWSAYVTIWSKRSDHEIFDPSNFCTCDILTQKMTNCSSNPKTSYLYPKIWVNSPIRTVRPRLSMACLSTWHLVSLRWPWVREGREKRAENLVHAAPPLSLPPWLKASCPASWVWQ